MAQDSDKKIKVGLEIPIEDEDEFREEDKRLDKAQEDAKRVADAPKQTPSLERDTSTGYNPNRYQNTGTEPARRTSSLNRDNELSRKPASGDASKPALPTKQTPAEAKPQDRKETAPDVGKDYGEGTPPSYPKYGEMPSQGTQESPVGEQSPMVASPKYNPEDFESGHGGLEKKDEDKLDAPDEKEKEPKEEPKGEDGERKTAGDEVEQNPMASKKVNPQDEVAKEAPSETSPGNGYGALKNRSKSNPEQTQDTENARKNLRFSQRVSQNQAQENGTNPAGRSSSGSINEPAQESLGSRLRNRLSGIFNGNTQRDVSNGHGRNSGDGNNPFNAAFSQLKKSIIEFLKTHPHVAVIIAAIILLVLILFIWLVNETYNNNGHGAGARCTYSLSGVLSTGTVNLEGLQVEVVNCDASANNYTVLETVDFEKYVVGVALAETGYSDSTVEAFKTQIVAARGFALTRNSSMCPSNPDDCFYGYNPNTGKIRLRACTNDQVYCDYDRDCYRMTRGSSPALFSPEIDENTSGAYVWKGQLSEELKAKVLAAADEVKGKVLLDESGNVAHTNYVNTDQQHWVELANQGKTYDEILIEHYGGGNVSGATCTSGVIDYGDYVLSSEGHTILHEPLDGFLEKNGTSLEAFNGLIAENVDKAGYGTRAGVVAAAVTLIAELGNNYGVKVPYYWGGGHYDGVVDGALGYWGSTQCHTYANNQSYDYCGFDCSGFVPWAIKNGGFNISQMLAGNFQNLPGVRRVNLSNSAVLQPGDLLESSGHIVLVVGIEESSGNYICAEASGNAAGVLFTRRPFNSSGYWGVEMDGFYETHQRSK